MITTDHQLITIIVNYYYHRWSNPFNCSWKLLPFNSNNFHSLQCLLMFKRFLCDRYAKTIWISAVLGIAAMKS